MEADLQGHCLSLPPWLGTFTNVARFARSLSHRVNPPSKMDSGDSEEAVSLTREQQHTNAVRRALWGTLAGFAFAGLAYLAGYLDFTPLRWLATIGFVGCLFYTLSVHVELGRIWFFRRNGKWWW